MRLACFWFSSYRPNSQRIYFILIKSKTREKQRNIWRTCWIWCSSHFSLWNTLWMELWPCHWSSPRHLHTHVNIGPVSVPAGDAFPSPWSSAAGGPTGDVAPQDVSSTEKGKGLLANFFIHVSLWDSEVLYLYSLSFYKKHALVHS